MACVRSRAATGDQPLPFGDEALKQPFNAFPSWFLRITCERLRQRSHVNQVHMPQVDLAIRGRTIRVGPLGRRRFCSEG